MKQMIKKSLMVALITLLSMNVLAADANNVQNSSCHVYVPSPDVYLNIFARNAIEKTTSEDTYTPEALKMFKEISAAIEHTNLNHLLNRKLIKKGYTVHLLNSGQTAQYLSLTSENDKNPPDNGGQNNGTLSQLGLKPGDLFLTYGLSFGFKIQPLRNERRMTWRFSLRENLPTKGLVDISIGQVSAVVFKFSPTEFRQNFIKALNKLPTCDDDDDDVLVGEDSEEDSTQGKEVTDKNSSASNESKS